MIDKKISSANNTPWTFWRLLDDQLKIGDWKEANRQSLDCLKTLPLADFNIEASELIEKILFEEIFGPSHWRLSPVKRLYYNLRPFLPASLRPLVRRLFASKPKKQFLLRWPAENRYVQYQYMLVYNLLLKLKKESFSHICFWPGGERFAFVLTHDVEGSRGQEFVPRIVELEQKYGFRSSFNFVPELYEIDEKLLDMLRRSGFEIGVHGLKHDGKLFSSREVFSERARKINAYLRKWGAVGFRSPQMHRHPVWLQDIEMEYDLSFFDTDPFEPMPGGTMSIWPFTIGHFVELPYTLVQDHTLMQTLGETTPRIWLDKVEFVSKYSGMALLNSHPDYLVFPQYFSIYEEFLNQMRQRNDYWHGLPYEVANWWKYRASLFVENWGGGGEVTSKYAVTICELRLADLPL